MRAAQALTKAALLAVFLPQVADFAAETVVLAERLKASGPGTPGVALAAGLELLEAFQKVRLPCDGC